MCIRDSINAEYMGKNNREKIEEWIEAITMQAKHEYEVSTELDMIKAKWESLILRVSMNGNKLCLGEPENLFIKLDKCINKLQVILSNEYAAPLREKADQLYRNIACLLYTSPSPRDLSTSRMPSSA
eukprot:TRINITY_DN8804_c0_g1_i2.p2 TRINITY_DN8804_c0_g1~~TRINITY_DN8804_c0_g1_i2.p2  ORF type:complete len:127 (-),score=33.35 TRINITY_DN8804_c0_g1_i2:126-506(-)